ncbi:LOW QUALITY PROTEIN: hypothetical protein PHMEG_0009096 [Phytophthora megakarya]|uniref:Uncharacterized protein n=1 Tax=Phytophthora megakarya TaxID=4795 RepID=A0A225WIF4_9STRA|nr:LOW QUALITY PROTEIN: hypothetical protein PHMEG_0009096 [Phytophthora megakarya]
MVPSPRAAPEGPNVVDELRALKEEVLRLHGHVSGQVMTSLSLITMGTPTAPNAKGELPPARRRRGTTIHPKPIAGCQLHVRYHTRYVHVGNVVGAVAVGARLDQVCRHPIRTDGHLQRNVGLLWSAAHAHQGVDLARHSRRRVIERELLQRLQSRCRSSVRQRLMIIDILDAIHDLDIMCQELWYNHMRKLTTRLGY